MFNLGILHHRYSAVTIGVVQMLGDQMKPTVAIGENRMEMQQMFTMSDMAKVMKAYTAWHPAALAVTYGDIWRTDVTDKGKQKLSMWAGQLREDRRKIARLAEKVTDWNDNERAALRALYQQKTNQIRDCAIRYEWIEEMQRAQMSIAERVEAYERNSENDSEHPFKEIPF